jgi:acyl-CoA reductase-like NAD-dependent aldehyde dehydrogenase
MDPKTLVGPVHNKMVVDIFTKSIERIKKIGSAKIICGGNVLNRDGYYCEPTIVEIDAFNDIL